MTYSVQFSSVAQLCPTLCDPVNRSTPGLPVHHQLPEFTQTHVHQVSDAIQPSHPLSSPSPPVPNPSQHQSFPMNQLFAWGGQSIGVSASTSVLPMNTKSWRPKVSFKRWIILNHGLPTFIFICTILRCSTWSPWELNDHSFIYQILSQQQLWAKMLKD